MDFNYYVNYFTMLEERLIQLKKYIAFEEENLEVFSIECSSIINDCRASNSPIRITLSGEIISSNTS